MAGYNTTGYLICALPSTTTNGTYYFWYESGFQKYGLLPKEIYLSSNPEIIVYKNYVIVLASTDLYVYKYENSVERVCRI